MTRLNWTSTPREYETGVDRGVFYASDGHGEVWNGLTSVQETPSESDEQSRYIDGVKMRSRRKPGEFSGVIEAFTYPQSFYEDVLTQRRAKTFGLSYRVATAKSYKIHVVYNVLLSTTKQSHQQTEADPFAWDFTTRPIAIPGSKASAHLVIDAGQAYPATIASLEALLYGSDTGASYLPDPTTILEIFEENSILRVVDNGDGSFTVTGPDSAIQMLDPTTFQITWPSAVYIDSESYTISSL